MSFSDLASHLYNLYFSCFSISLFFLFLLTNCSCGFFSCAFLSSKSQRKLIEEAKKSKHAVSLRKISLMFVYSFVFP